MGGLDKGLQPWQGEALVQHALRRLQPQVTSIAISANRHLDAYAAYGVPVLPDEREGFEGPLAGWLTGLRHCTTPWLASVPCDVPAFPLDLVQNLAAAACRDGAQIAIAATRDADGALRLHPVFALLDVRLAPCLQRHLEGGGRKLADWTAQQARTIVPFDDAEAFRNLNTLDDLRDGY
jgi:molybdopterin-guanine dinucleotide biosynthesis protein A